MPLAFVLDEHLRGPLRQAVIRHNLTGEDPIDIKCVGDDADLPLGAADQTVLLWAERKRWILVTEDRRTMVSYLRDHLQSGHHSPGVLIARAGQRMHALVECLVLIAYGGATTSLPMRFGLFHRVVLPIVTALLSVGHVVRQRMS